MVTRKPKSRTVKRTQSKPKVQSKQRGTIVTATFVYGPFRTKKDAESHRSQAARVNNAVVSPVKSTQNGYAYMSQTRIGARNKAEEAKAEAMIKKHSPNAKISRKQF